MKNNTVVPATAIVFNKNREILLAQRFYEDDPKNRYHGAWGFPGGRIEKTEQPMDTAIRETKEETGIDIQIISDRPIVMSCIEQTGKQVIKLAYLAKYRAGEIDVSKDAGTSNAKWFPKNEIKKLLTTLLTREILEKAFILYNTKY